MRDYSFNCLLSSFAYCLPSPASCCCLLPLPPTAASCCSLLPLPPAAASSCCLPPLFLFDSVTRQQRLILRRISSPQRFILNQVLYGQDSFQHLFGAGRA